MYWVCVLQVRSLTVSVSIIKKVGGGRFVVCAFTFLARTHSVEEQSPQAEKGDHQ